MAKQVINVGVSANDGSGDTLRNSQQKANSNFTELYDRGLQEITDVNNETTNPIYVADGGSESIMLGVYYGANKFGISNGGEGYFNNNVKIDTNGDGTIIAEIHATDLTSSRVFYLPNFNCNLNGCTTADNYTNDVTAAVGGIAIGQMYHTAGVVKIRLT